MSGTNDSPSATHGGNAGSRLSDVGPLSTAASQHRGVRTYASERSLAHIVAEFLAEGFDHGNPGIVIATAEQRAAIVQELMDRSLDALALQRSQDLVLLDAAQVLSRFMIDGQPDARKFRDEMCRVVETVTRGRSRSSVRVFGQLVDVLWQQGQRDAAARLELLWNQLARAGASTLVCGYAIGHLGKNAPGIDRPET